MSAQPDRMGISGRISAAFQRNALTPLLALVLMLMGIFATLITPKEEEPQIDVTMANVLVPFPGASARDVEALVSRPGEQVLSRIAGVEHVYSVSRPGMSVITVQFEVGVKNNDALVRLYDTIDSHRDWLSPQLGVMQPVVKPKGIDDVPIVALTFWTEDSARSGFELQQVSRAIEVEIKRIDGTRDVTTIGGPGHVVKVEMMTERMNAYGVTAQDLKAALQISNASLPAGSLTADNREVLVQTGTYLESADDVRRLVVGTNQGKPVFMQDVAEVGDGPGENRQYVWFGTGSAATQRGVEADGLFPAVTLSVSKKPGANASDVADAVIARAESLRNTVIPEGIEMTVTRNYGQTASDKAEKLIGKLVFATSAVVALVFFALGRREAAIVGVAVILTLTVTLFASWAWGFTLNRVSLFALIFSIGILVDDAIVVVENIHRHQALEPGKSLREIIPGAVDEVGGPTILATLTVIAALLPMAFVSGLMGPYMSPIPINASMGMVLSLAIAFMVTPWLARLWMKATHAGDDGTVAGHGLARRMAPLFHRIFRPLLDERSGRRNRSLLGLAVAGLIALSVLLPVFGLVVLKMLPFDNKSEFQVVVDMPAGTPVEKTAAVLHALGAHLATVPEVTNYQAYAGTASPINFNGLVRQYYLRAGGEVGDIQVNLVDKSHRHEKSHAIAMRERPALRAIGERFGANVKVVEVPPGPPVMAPIVAEVYGPDAEGRRAVARQVRGVFEATPGVVDVDDSTIASAPKTVLVVDRTKAAQLGVTQQAIASTLRMGLAGDAATYLHDASRYAVPATIQLPPQMQGSLDALLQLTVRSQAGTLVPIRELVRVSDTVREQPVYHKDLLPVVFVVGDMAGTKVGDLDSPLYGMFQMRSKLADLKMPDGGQLTEYFIRQPANPYAGYALKWDGEWQITYETFRDMGAAYAVGLILIYLLVVAQFGSYLTPLIIMAPIPLTVIGVMPGHALLGAQFTATSMIGMIALAGIIVRNSILLVDFINLQVAEGVPFRRAIVASAITRAQPILLTGLAAMIGALFILGDPIFNGLAISLIFGIMVSTVLTLVVIPILYYMAYRKRYGDHELAETGAAAGAPPQVDTTHP